MTKKMVKIGNVDFEIGTIRRPDDEINVRIAIHGNGGSVALQMTKEQSAVVGEIFIHFSKATVR
jgi:hypothetical protein